MGIGPLEHQKKEIRKELNQLLKSEYPDWKVRQYLSTNFIIANLNENPDAYPLLSKVKSVTVRRWLNWHLRELGRVPTNENASQIRTWMKPEMAA